MDNKLNKRLDRIEEKFESKLDQLTNDFNEQKIKCEQQNIKNDIIFKEIKDQNTQLQQSISAVSYTHLDVYKRQLFS